MADEKRDDDFMCEWVNVALVPAHLGSPRQRAIKRQCVCVVTAVHGPISYFCLGRTFFCHAISIFGSHSFHIAAPAVEILSLYHLFVSEFNIFRKHLKTQLFQSPLVVVMTQSWASVQVIKPSTRW